MDDNDEMRRNGRVKVRETRTETLGESSVGAGLDEDEDEGGLRSALA